MAQSEREQHMAVVRERDMWRERCERVESRTSGVGKNTLLGIFNRVAGLLKPVRARQTRPLDPETSETAPQKTAEGRDRLSGRASRVGAARSGCSLRECGLRNAGRASAMRSAD